MLTKTKYKKVVIWGYPFLSHTHSFVHAAYYKAFKHAGYDVYWFHDKSFPVDFDYNNCIFIAEGFSDNNIPIVESSCYFVMYCPSPAKYINRGVRYIDVRCAASGHVDHIHNYSLDKNIAEKVGPACYIERAQPHNVRIHNNYHNYEIQDFDKLYISWATDLLPHEFNFDDIFFEREKNIYFCGTISPLGTCENETNWRPFLNECGKNGIQFIHNCPWRNPLSSEVVRELTKKSYLGIDIRSKEHVRTGIVTCRVFKNISYDHLGMTNSKEIYNELDGNCVYNPDSSALFYDGVEHMSDFKFIKSAMLYVKDNHTYINRINTILSIL